ncbi:ankyrin repeat and SAM domain-containing protein 1A [Octopus sinensis]|uniref:Ankyrin repeat and SAM domain-containing protein 1A n=1 Tax=Octopus sinensis TaxID=2607531 RepID=A0A6P7U3M3_9MOLL|nr:ankyrin repeat and SAM domain-containing protein 1A [Octopus sinensis]
MQSFGAGIARESVFVRDYEADFTKLLAAKTKIQSVGEWLEDMALGQYENTLVANGYDDMDFLGGNILEDPDLQEIGIKDPKHRRQILEAAKSLPKVKPISADNMPGSVAEWLQSLRLIDYCDTFISHGFDQMERVRQLWELELTTVLDIGTLGHRKRLLASLGEKQVPVPDVTKRHSSPFVSNLEESKPYFHDLNLFKDYSNLCSSTIQPEDLRKPSSVCATIGPVPCLSSQFNGRDADEIRREGKHIQDESVHIRPPHLAQSTSPVKQWCHKPEVLIKGCCNYIAQYLGSAVVWQLNGIDSTREGIAKMKYRFWYNIQVSTTITNATTTTTTTTTTMAATTTTTTTTTTITTTVTLHCGFRPMQSQEWQFQSKYLSSPHLPICRIIPHPLLGI